LWSVLAGAADCRKRSSQHEVGDQRDSDQQGSVAINQDALGREGKRVWKEGDLEIWAKPMKDGSRAAVLLNRSASEAEITVSWTTLAYPEHLSAAVRDLWHTRIWQVHRKFSAKVGPHDVVVVTVKP